jgi:hypothetical protein
LVSSVNSTKFPIFWQTFWHKKNMKNKNNECILIYLMFTTFCWSILCLDMDTWIFQHVKNISKEIGQWPEIVFACFISLFYIIVLCDWIIIFFSSIFLHNMENPWLW